MHRDCAPLVLDVGVGHAEIGQQLRYARPSRRDGGVVGGGGDPAGFPALDPVVAEDHEPVDVGQTRVLHRQLGRPPGDNGEAAEVRCEPLQGRGYVGVRAGLVGVGNDRCQRAVEVEADQRPTRRVQEGGQPGATRLGRRCRQAHPLSPGRVGDDDGQPGRRTGC